VADGSDSVHAERNAACADIGDNIRYFYVAPRPEIDPWSNYNERIERALDMVETPYCIFSAEDDLVVIENVIKAAEFLDNNPSYAGCHGKYLHYIRAGNSIKVERVAYEAASIDGEEVSTRLMQLFSNYEAFFYAVFPTAVQRKLFKQSNEGRHPLWPEIYHSTAAVIQGKIKRLDNIYSLRNTGVAPHVQPISDLTRWIAKDFDDFIDRYRQYCERVAEWTAGRDDLRIDAVALRHALDMAFAVYLGRMFSLPDWIDEYASIAVADERERAALRLRVRQNFSKTTVLPLSESFRHVLKSVVGRKWVTAAQRARAHGLRYALARIPEFDPGFWRAKFSGAPATLHVPPDLADLFPRQQWDLIR
jgi:glycosyltransferase domain-containing protein